MKFPSIIFLLIFTINSSLATVYSVGTNNELNTAIDDVVPGDTIEMEDGIWMDSDIVFDANGTASNPIVLLAKNPGQVILSGMTDFRIGGDYLIVSGLIFEDCIATESNLIAFRRTSSDLANHSRMTDCVIKNCNPSDPTVNYKWIGMYGTYNELDHCYIENKTHIGACVVVWSNENEAHHHIHHNYFGPSPEGNGNGWETIRIGTSSWAQYAGYNLVEHNYFHKRDGEIEIISGKSSFTTYKFNIFKECKGGLTLRHGTDCLVEGNIFLGGNKSGSYGVRTIDKNHTVINNYFEGLNGASSGLRYAISLMGGEENSPANGYQPNINNNYSYNTIVNCTKGIMIGAESWPVAPDNCVFANNVVSITNAPPVVHNNPPTNTTYIGNYFYRSDGSVTVPSTGYQDVDPELYIPSGDSIYRPQVTSPLIGAAVTGWSIEDTDFEFQNRPSAPTVGADEISSDPIIDRGIYGPTWLVEEETIGQSSILMEAEEATWGTSWSLESDDLACGSEYLLPPDASSLNSPPTTLDDLVTFTFTIDQGGIYKIFARTLTTGGDDDSFWVRANGGTWQKWNAINGPDYPQGYQWSQVGHWTGGSTADPVTFMLTPGQNTVDFAWREEEARLDKVYVTGEDLNSLNLVQNNTVEDQYSLKYAVENACPLDTIYFADSTNNIVFPISSNSIEISFPLTIVGNGETLTELNGMNTNLIFINNSNNLTLQNLRLVNGYSQSNGGAILNNGTLTLSNVIFENNYESLTLKPLTNNGTIVISTNGNVHILE